MRPPPLTQSPTLLKPLTLSSISPKLPSLKLLRQRQLWTKLRNLRSLILLKISTSLVKMRPPPLTQSPTLLKPLTLSSISPKLLSLKLMWQRLLWTKLRNLRSLISLKISMSLAKMRPPPLTQSPTLLKPPTLSSISPKLLSLKLLRPHLSRLRLLRPHLLLPRLLWTKLRNLRQRKPRMHKLMENHRRKNNWIFGLFQNSDLFPSEVFQVCFAAP